MNDTTHQQPALRMPEELLASPLFLLKRLGMAAKEATLPAYEAAGLHPYHYAILALLDEGHRETQGEIADALGYDRGQLVGLLDELEEAALVERRRDANDRRRQIVEMTPVGKKTLATLRALSSRIDDEFLAPLDAEQREQLRNLLLVLAGEHLPQCRFAAKPVGLPSA
jgi:DNA-binding MarR family transcriptional regulator